MNQELDKSVDVLRRQDDPQSGENSDDAVDGHNTNFGNVIVEKIEHDLYLLLLDK
jgi:hypothetical protein